MQKICFFLELRNITLIKSKNCKNIYSLLSYIAWKGLFCCVSLFTLNFLSFFYALQEKTRSTWLIMIESNKILKQKKIFFFYFLFVSISAYKNCSSSGQDRGRSCLDSLILIPPFHETILDSSTFEFLINSPFATAIFYTFYL